MAAFIKYRIGLINRAVIVLRDNDNFLMKCSFMRFKFTDSVDNDLFLEDKFEEEISRKTQTKKPLTKSELLKKQRTYVKNRIIVKKLRNFHRQKEPTILTWAARSQIQYLHKKDPIYWTPEMLSQSFPVPVNAIKAILRYDFLPPNEKFVQEYDQDVISNWIQLAKEKRNLIEGKPVDPKFRSLLESEKMSYIVNAAGSKSFPIPEPQNLQKTLLDVAEERRPKTRGILSAILDDYKKDKEFVKENKETNYIDFEDPKYIDLLKDLSQIASKEFQDLLEARTREQFSDQDDIQDTGGVFLENHTDTELVQYRDNKFTQNSKIYTDRSPNKFKDRYQKFSKDSKNVYDKRGKYTHSKENSYEQRKFNRKYERK
ncbi:uncharacterized protein LOC132758954 [Ruditapes philippinarum]|uniref:uncharacterized protein LOC132758954 n=1 Tax=Ruditapes philippinarum TaxID=129788 RepID=UPI00295A66B9|nr:uncharacterized protein LOC132758954 [Ruditapes philippinarum]